MMPRKQVLGLRRPPEDRREEEPAEITKEWLEQVIISNIQPRIDSIVINPVELKTQRLGRFAYVVCVPQSDRAPHQANDKRYYKRFNFQSVPMEDHEVRDVMFRQRVPEGAGVSRRTGFPELRAPWVRGTTSARRVSTRVLALIVTMQRGSHLRPSFGG
ncbi:MAG TPA: ATP-binding protein [Planctomycetota bacterium]|nr:ATP-binding protein [Planctomycetota bacterium]